LDVHAPHQSIHTWKDFFVHLTTITIGLLIALSLEGAVEWSHHRHLVHEALEKTYFEIRNNRKLLAADLTEIREDLIRTQTDLKILVGLRSAQKLEPASLEYHIDWSSFADSAWRTAEATGAVNYMDYQTAQDLADVYAQQRIVSHRGLKMFEDQSLAIAPIFITGDPKAMSTEEVQLTLQRSADLLLNLRGLEQLLTQLDAQFLSQLKKNDK
jgi:hypothetical protein